VLHKRFTGIQNIKGMSTNSFCCTACRDELAAVWIAAAAIHREKNTVEAAAAAGLQPQQAAANKLYAAPGIIHKLAAHSLRLASAARP
jgi:hypothetical protein